MCLYVIENMRCRFSVSNEEKWEGWSNTPFVNSVEEKIIEYRRKKAESEVVAEQRDEADFFNDMQPKVVQTRRAFIDNYCNTPIQNSNLFAVKIDEVLPSHLGELDNLEDASTYDENEVWDTQIDIESVDKALREQKAKERQERRLARQMEHAKRFERRKE
ncbi:unnamed protein product [Acanthocheilonema viteae]|uniref:Receptor-binding cancer antigen expressed on SiSo cells n=1 Tax=Acanthocheilonema viteae TaxID=6277 RepID=A0A498SQY6_ACAVI|nr:unnamed protein product [Acanthocheilonema viteae]